MKGAFFYLYHFLIFLPANSFLHGFTQFGFSGVGKD